MALPLPAQDADLVILARRGSGDAFGALYERYFPGVYDFLTRLLRDRQEAADVAQDTFIKAFERLSHLQNPESFKSWLFTIAHRNGLNRIERSKRAVAVGDFYVSDREAGELGVIDPDRASDPERSAEARAAANIIWEAAAGLDPRTYSVMDLHVRQGLDSAEIAEVLGVSKGNAYTMVSRMKKSFSETLSIYLLVRKGASDCDDLAALVAADTGTGLTPELRKTADRHAKSCDVCEDNRKALFIPIKMFAALAAAPIPAGLKAAVWGSVQTAVVGAGAMASLPKAGASAGATSSTSGAAAQPAAQAAAGAAAAQWLRSHIGGLAAAAVILVLLFVGGAALLRDNPAAAPTEVLSGGVTVAPSEGGATTTVTLPETTVPATTAPPGTTVPATTSPPVTTTLAPAATTTTTTSTTSAPQPPGTTAAPVPTLVVRADTATLREDTTVVIDVLANDSNFAPGAAPAVATAPQHGSAGASGASIVYTPNPDYAGTDRLAYSVKGRDGTTRTAQVTLTVVGVNDAPEVPGPGALVVEEDGTITFDPLAGAVDVDGDSLEMTNYDASSENGGTVTAGSLVYTPAANWSGSDKFSYTVSDGTVDVVVRVGVSVTAVNDVPSGPDPVLNAVEDGSGEGNVLEGWSDAEGDRVFIDNPGNRTTDQGGSATVGAQGNAVYTPPANFSGTDTFRVRVTDGTDAITVTVRVDVDPANDPPTVDDQTFTTSESTAAGTVVGTAVASDPDGDDVTIESTSSSVFDVLSNGDVILRSALDFETASSHQLEAQAVDVNGAATPFTITLVVTDVDEAPVVSPSSWTISSSATAGTVVGTIVATDPEGLTLTYRISDASGTITVDAASGVVTLTRDVQQAQFPIIATGFAADPAGHEGGAALTINIDDVDGPDIDDFEVDVEAVYAPPAGGGVCSPQPRSALFSANLSDPSGVLGADLFWRMTVQGVAWAGVAKMTPMGDGRFEVDFTPPPGIVRIEPETMYAKVAARDNLNNFSESAEITLTVLPCQED